MYLFSYCCRYKAAEDREYQFKFIHTLCSEFVSSGHAMFMYLEYTCMCRTFVDYIIYYVFLSVESQKGINAVEHTLY